MYPELWWLLKTWDWITNETEFNMCCEKIQELALESFVAYIKMYWFLWSVYGLEFIAQTVQFFELCDTYMLVEA